MSNETTTEGPLKATLGEQLGEKAQHGDPHAREVVEGDALRARLGASPGAAAEDRRPSRGRPAARRAGGWPAWVRWAAAGASWMLVKGTVRRLVRR